MVKYHSYVIQDVSDVHHVLDRQDVLGYLEAEDRGMRGNQERPRRVIASCLAWGLLRGKCQDPYEVAKVQQVVP